MRGLLSLLLGLLLSCIWFVLVLPFVPLMIAKRFIPRFIHALIIRMELKRRGWFDR